jgi:type IV fimbrial biogenesis protein FimT
MHRRHAGFTLLELLTVVTIAGLLLAVAVPSMRAFVQNSRMTGAANDLVRALQVARTEAVKRRRNVVVCTADDPLAATPACAGEATLNGWVVFVDSNSDGAWNGASFNDVDGDGNQDPDEDLDGNGLLDPGEDVDADGNLDVAEDSIPAEDILLTHAPLHSGITANSRQDEDTDADFFVSYDATGFLAGTAVGAVVMCDDRGNAASFGDLSAARGVTISATGRVATTRGIEEIDDLGGC